MILIGQKIKRKIDKRNINHFKSLNYNVKLKDIIYISPEHLNNMNENVKVKCDNCKKTKTIKYCLYLKNIEKHNIYTCSSKCAHAAGKNKKTKKEKYGDENYNNTEKRKQKKLERYGDENYCNSEKISESHKNKTEEEKQEIVNKREKTKEEKYSDPHFNNREKNKKTLKDKYGIEHNSQMEVFPQKMKETWEKKTKKEIQEIINKRSKTFLKLYGVDHISKTEEFSKLMKALWKNKSDHEIQEIISKSKRTKLINHGDPNFNNREQSVKTCLVKYGVEVASQSSKVIKKIEQTKEQKYGDPNYNNREQSNQTKKERYNNENYNNPEKYKQTCLNKYGVEHPTQILEIFNNQHKNSYKLKEYVLPSGKIVKIQGYEYLSLDLLLKTYKEQDLLINDKDIENRIGKIWYFDKNNKKRRYYPDIYIISKNKIVEVKSDWTYKSKKDNIFLKKQACLSMGMKFEFVVFNGKKKLLTKEEIKHL